MSYPGVDPADMPDYLRGNLKTNPVEQQEMSAGVPVALASNPTPNYDKMHEDALNGGGLSPLNESLKSAVSQAIKDEFEVSDAWSGKKLFFVINCPSGQKCLAKKLDTMDLVESDLIDEIDFFSRKLFPKGVDASGKPIEQENEEESFAKILQDPEKKKRFFGLLDGLLELAIEKPKVHQLPHDVDISGYSKWEGPALNRGHVWANKVAFEDKLHIFTELNQPLEQIKTFRVESQTGVPGLVPGEGVRGTS